MTSLKKNKKIVILTGTRADFGKLKSIILATQDNENLDLSLFVTGMHLNPDYGYTVNEIYNSKIKNIHEFNNFSVSKKMDIVLSETIKGFSQFIEKDVPDSLLHELYNLMKWGPTSANCSPARITFIKSKE